MNRFYLKSARWWVAGGGALGALLLLPLEAMSILEAAPRIHPADFVLALLFSGTLLGVFGAVGGLLWRAAVRTAETGRWGAFRVAFFALLPVVLLQLFLTRGGWISKQVWLWPVFFLLLAGEALAFYIAARLLGRARRLLARPGRRLLFAFAAGAGALSLSLADRLILPGLYPAAHAALAAGALLLAAAAGVCASFPGRVRLYMPAFSVVLFLPAMALLLGTRRAAWGAVARSSPVGRGATQVAVAIGLGPRLPEEQPAREKGALLWPEDVARPDLSGADLVIITIDALRPDRLGIYNPAKNLSPNLDALARKSIVFDRAYAPSPTSSYSLTSIFCSRYAPSRVEVAPGPWMTLAEHLAAYGYRTHAIYNEGIFFTDTEHFLGYKENHFGFSSALVEYLDAYEISRRGARFLLEGRAPAFLWVHIAEPHEPYQVRPGFSRGETPQDRYDAEVAYADHHLAQLLKHLEGRRVVVAVLADHGEAFGEHGAYYHTSDVYAEQTRIPFFIYYPGATPRRIEAPVSPVDLTPTLLDLLGLPELPGAEGRSIAPLLVGQAPDDAPVFSEWGKRRAVARGRYRLICDQSTRACELFDIQEDPEETRDISSSHPEEVASLMGELSAFLRAQQTPPENAFAWPEPILQAAAGQEHALAALPAYLSDDSPAVRARAAELLGKSQDATFVSHLLPLLADSAPEVRIQAAFALGELKEPQAIPALRELLAHPSPETAGRAAVLLGALGEASPREISLGLLSKQLETKRQALTLLAAQGPAVGQDREVVIRIVKLFERSPLAPEAARTLARIEAKSAVPPLVWLLRTATQIPTRAAAVEALAALGDPRATDALAERAAFGEGGDQVGEALLAVGGNPPQHGAGGSAARVVQGGAWRCEDEGCQLTRDKGDLRFSLPDELSHRPYTLLLSASGKGMLRVSSGDVLLGEAILSDTPKDLRFPLQSTPFSPGGRLQLTLSTAGELKLRLGMVLPVPDDPSTRFKE